MDDIYAMMNEHELGVQTTASFRRGRAGRGGSRGRSSDCGGCAPPSSGQACLHRRRGHQNEEEEEAAACSWPARRLMEIGQRAALLDERVVSGEVDDLVCCVPRAPFGYIYGSLPGRVFLLLQW